MGGITADMTGLSVVVRRGVAVPEGPPVEALGVVLPDARSAVPRGLALPGWGLASTEGRGVSLPGVDAESGRSCLTMDCQAPGTAKHIAQRQLMVKLHDSLENLTCCRLNAYDNKVSQWALTDTALCIYCSR